MKKSRTVLLATALLFSCDGQITSGDPNGEGDGSAVNPGDIGWKTPVGDGSSCNGCLVMKKGKGGKAFDTSSDDSEFVTVDKDGSLIIDMKSSKLSRNLWVADTNLPGVVKIDLPTRTIVGRYVTGGASTSRTTVNSIGEAFIGARTNSKTKAGVTKILPDGAKCPDTNADGKVTTSTGASNVYSYGKDDCVAWHVETEGDIRGLAAQDIPGLNHNDVCKGYTGDKKEFDPKKVLNLDLHYIWVGGLHGKIYKIDAKTGKVLIKTAAPTKVYGMALDGNGKLWMLYHKDGFGFLDTTKCKDQKSCDAATICTATCSGNSCPSTCDNATKARYSGAPSGYGITVDYKQRVWWSGYPTAATVRYDPKAPTNKRLAFSAVGAWGGGIAVDAAGWVWAAHLSGNYVVRVHSDTMAGTTIKVPSKGVAVDIQGRVYSVEYKGAVHLIEPGATLTSYKLTQNAVPLKGIAYAYSDMTGVQTRLASGEPGYYRTVFSPCVIKKATVWKMLTWDVDVPKDTWAMFNVRSADTAAGLKQASWYTVACINPPGGKGQVSIEFVKKPYLEVEVRFIATGDLNKPSSVSSARIKSFGVLYLCQNVK